MYRIPFNRPSIVGNELTYIQQAVEMGHISGGGPFTLKCEEALTGWFEAAGVFLTPSCTHALELAALLMDIQPGDEVILPSFTFPSTANAFALRGARLTFADIRSDTLNLDEERLEALITPQTRVICAVHYAGVGCEMDAILSLANAYGIRLVEDNAQGLFGFYRGRKLGTFSEMSCLSFHETKNLSCGEGGAIILNDPQLVERAEIIREKGTDRGRFFRGEVREYTWIEIGSSYLPSDIQAAYLLAQWEQRDRIQLRRKTLWHAYLKGLSDWAADHDVQLPAVPPDCDPPYHIFYLLLPDERSRNRLIEHLRTHGILAVFHYLPLHQSKMGRSWGQEQADCPVTEWASARILRLPLYYSLSDEDQDFVIETIRSFKMEQG